jgi:hypothetical protein
MNTATNEIYEAMIRYSNHTWYPTTVEDIKDFLRHFAMSSVLSNGNWKEDYPFLLTAATKRSEIDYELIAAKMSKRNIRCFLKKSKEDAEKELEDLENDDEDEEDKVICHECNKPCEAEEDSDLVLIAMRDNKPICTKCIESK